MNLQANSVWNPAVVCAPSDQETDERADSFHLFVYHQCREHLENVIDRLRGGAFGVRLQAVVIRKVGIKFEQALKLLTCASIHLCGIENGGAANPRWFAVFLFRSLLHADAMCSEPRAKFVIEQVGSLKSSSMIIEAAQAALRELGIEEQSVAEELAKGLLDAHEVRLQMLRTALLIFD
jgi:hypothetical protein